MRSILAFLILLLLCSGCGGGGGDSENVTSLDGTWTGTVRVDESGCTQDPAFAAEPSFLDVSGQEFRFEVSGSANSDRVILLVDQAGRTYRDEDDGDLSNGFIVTSDEFFSRPEGSHENSREEDGPTNISFYDIRENRAHVKLYYFQNRFCTLNFVGDFERVGE